MLPRLRFVMAAVLGTTLLAGSLQAAGLTDSLKKGTPDLKSAGALAFGPEGILFVGDSLGGAIFAIDTGDRPASPATGGVKVAKIDDKIGALLGTNAKGIAINDLAVNPASGNAYLSVTRGQGAGAAPVIVRVDHAGKIDELALKDVPFAKAELPNAPPAGDRRRRQEAITQLEYVKGKVYVAGLSNEEFASTLRAVPFPFSDVDKGAGIKIFHGAHGGWETASPVRTFTAYDIGGETNLLAAYTCTPLVKIPVSQLQPGAKVTGTTIAELGNGNKPLDMIVYKKNGKDYILLSNSRRGIMKITTENIDKIAGIEKRISGGGKAGLPYETIQDWKGVEQLAQLDKEHALLLMRSADGALTLDTVELP